MNEYIQSSPRGGYRSNSLLTPEDIVGPKWRPWRQLTPPVGITSFVCLDVTKVPIGPYLKEIGPFLVAIFFVLVVTTYIPQVVLFIPNLVFGTVGAP